MGLSTVILILSQAFSSQFHLEQMYEGDEAIVSTAARKKKRCSGFKFSSKKVLQHSRVKRETSKVGGNQFDSVTKALSFTCEIGDNKYHDCVHGSNLPTSLDCIVELDGDCVDMSNGDAVILDGCTQMVGNF